MRTLTTYVLFEFLKILALALAAMTALIFVVLLGREAVEHGLSFLTLFEIAPFVLIEAMQYAVPGTMLLAATAVYGRMSGFNEITAIKSLGISPMVVVWPTMVLAVVASLAAVALNDLAVSWGHESKNRVIIESLEEVVYAQLKMYRTFSAKGLSITVRNVEGHRLIQPIFISQGTDERPGFTATGTEGEIRCLPDEGKIVIRVDDAEIIPLQTGKSSQQGFQGMHPGTLYYEISFAEWTGETSGLRSPSHYALGGIPEAVEEANAKLRSIDQSNTADVAFAMLTGQFDSLSDKHWELHENRVSDAQYRLHRFYTEPWRRWANGFSCLCFVIVGAPLAIRFRHAEFLAVFFVCFSVVLLVYYPLLVVGVNWAKKGAIPPQAVWIGNIVLCMWGIWLMRRVIRH
jgi:lipopolysaccharide export system permease protein